MTKYKAPAGMTEGLAVGGEFLQIDAEGHVTVPDDYDATMLLAVGFTPVPATPPAP